MHNYLSKTGFIISSMLFAASAYAIETSAVSAGSATGQPAAAPLVAGAAPAATTAPATTTAPAANTAPAAATTAPAAVSATPAAAAKVEAADPKKADKPATAPAAKSTGTIVELKTSEGVIKVELADKEAPLSVANFLGYVNGKFYDGTVFHRVIDGFMIQGGGYTVEGEKLAEKTTKAPVPNEAKNGLKNDKGTISMARTSNPDSGTSQFYINLVNNDRLNYPNPDGHGYAVFGRVIEGLDVVEKIGKVRTAIRFNMQDFPVADVRILSANVVKAASH